MFIQINVQILALQWNLMLLQFPCSEHLITESEWKYNVSSLKQQNTSCFVNDTILQTKTFWVPKIHKCKFNQQIQNQDYSMHAGYCFTFFKVKWYTVLTRTTLLLHRKVEKL